MTAQSKPDFLDATRPTQGARILGRWVPRARLGLHLRLGRLAEQAQAAFDRGELENYSRLVAEYLHLCGLNPYRWPRLQWGRYSGAELRQAFLALTELNAMRWLLPFMEEPGQNGPPSPADYPGRVWAWWVHELASRYGWAPETIWNLWPEEAAAYMQEIIVSGYYERDWQRSLSETGWSYDKASGKSYFRPTPRPGWLVPKKPEPRIRVRKSWLPMGTVQKV